MKDLAKDLSPNNADPSNWRWNLEEKEQWQRAQEEWQSLHQDWYGQKNKTISHVLGVHARLLEANASKSIYIRPAYLKMFDNVYERAMTFQGRKSVIITGQPGTGKTFFLHYALVRLLQLKQAVLFSPNGQTIFLFFHDGVYSLPTEKACNDILPIPKESTKAFMWSLFDIAAQAEPPQVLVHWPCFPVQTASPSPTRFKIWSKNHSPLHAGMPLWSKEELAQGLKCQNDYEALKEAIQMFYTPGFEDALSDFPGAGDLLTEGFAQAKSPNPEEAVDFLLDEAIRHFGHSARDVYNAVFDFNQTTEDHLSSFNLDLPQLLSTISNVVDNQNLLHPTSHRILAVIPVIRDHSGRVTWKIDFKSDWVWSNIKQRLQTVEEREIARTICYLQNIPQAGSLAGRFLEPFAHRQITQTANPGTFWKLSVMNSEGNGDAPHFKLAREMQVSVKFEKVQRAVVKFKSLDDISLTNNTYYIPTNATFPLFDSFAIELDFETMSGVLWVFQITTSRRHHGSRTGYEKVGKIIEKLEKKLEEIQRDNSQEAPPKRARIAPSVEVRYILVVPESEGLLTEWYFPPGWKNHRASHDHRGKVYCLELALIVPHPEAHA